MGFVQIIEFASSQIDEMRAASEEWAQATEGKRTSRRSVLCADRDQRGRYVNIVFFDSYDEAMRNSALPETERLAAKLASLADGPPVFHNLDVLEDRA